MVQHWSRWCRRFGDRTTGTCNQSSISSDWIASIGWQNVIFIYWTSGTGCGMVYLATRMSASVVNEASLAARLPALIVEWSHRPPTLVIGVESLDTDWWHQSLEQSLWPLDCLIECQSGVSSHWTAYTSRCSGVFDYCTDDPVIR